MREHPFPDLASRIPMKDIDEGCKLCRRQQHLVALFEEKIGKYKIYCYYCLPAVAQEMLDRWNQGSLVKAAIRKRKRAKR